MPNDFRYAAVNRPPGYATVPDGYTRVEERPHAGAPFHDIARHGFVIYARPLTDKETRSYELAPVLGEAGERAIAETIVSGAAEYAEQYIEIASDDFEDFRAMVGSHFDGMFSNATGYRPAIADFDGFVRRVLDGLIERAEKAAEAARDAEFSDSGEYGIGKTEYDYANHLIAKRAIGLAPAPVSLFETAHVEPSAFTNPHDLFAGDGCAPDSHCLVSTSRGQDGI